MNTSQETSARENAKARLWGWGSCIRVITMAGIPNGNYYSQQPFASNRINFDFKETEQDLYRGNRWEKAIEIDEILVPVRESNDATWAATIIRYVWRERGTGGSKKLAQEYQLRQFHHLTSLGKVSYYNRLKRIEHFIAMALGSS